MNDSQAIPRDLWPLVPQGPDDARALFDALREQMRQTVIGHDDLISRLALAGTRHMAQDLQPLQKPTRILLKGNAGTGKTLLATALARTLGLPWVLIPVGELAETNWAGTDVPAILSGLLDDVATSYSPQETARWLARAVVIVDDLDRLRLPGRYSSGSGTTHDYQAGRQRSLLPILGNGVVPVKRGSRTLMWHSGRALVVSCARFPELPEFTLNASDLRDWGLVAELAETLCEGTLLTVPDLGRGQVIRILHAGVPALAARFEVFGYSLRVSDQAIRVVAERIQSGRLESGIRQASAWLAEGAERLLIRLVEERADTGTRRVLAPDDLHLPEPGRGLWRE